MTGLVHIMLHACMSTGLLFGSGQQIGVLLIGEDNFSCSQLASVASSSLCMAKPVWTVPHSPWQIHWCYPCLAHI